jgi:phosphosulfolactate synthase (CoM biosynthesis protein A)
MKEYKVHVLTEGIGFKSAKEELSKKVEIFLNEKSNEGYEVVNISFTYFESSQLIAFITISKNI